MYIYVYQKSLSLSLVCEIKREDDVRIHKIFQDPKAQHLLICMESKESYYVPRGGPKKPQPRPLPKFKGHLIESVAWNKVEQSDRDQTTGAILLGTNAGMYMYNTCRSYLNKIHVHVYIVIIQTLLLLIM